MNVVVAGGGPAGSATALALARAGIPVTIVERARFPRRKVCGEYLNAGALAELDALGLRERVLAGARPLTGIRLVPPDADAVELAFPEPACSLPREILDDRLLGAAREAGAEVVEARVEGLLHERGRVGGVVLREPDGALRTRSATVVVGADGIGSLVARKAGLAQEDRGGRYAVGGHYTGFAGTGTHVEMYVGAGAYFAINPLSDDRANVMVVVKKERLASWSRDVDGGVTGAAAELGRGHRSFAGTRRIGERVAVGPLRHRVRRVAAPGVLLVGDAAGFLNPFTGQGVFLALRTAREAARAIVHGERAFARYNLTRRIDFAQRQAVTRVVDLLIDAAPLARRATERLRERPDLARELLAAVGGSAIPALALRPDVVGRLLW